MSTPTILIPRAVKAYKWTEGQIRSFPQLFPNAFLPSTHWVPAKIPFNAGANQAICRIYPRPDSECNAWARHKWFYYDGTNKLPQVIPLGVRGGAWPYVWVIMEAPTAANATIGSVYQGGLPSAQYNGYGDLIVTPTGAFTSALFWVRGYGQDGDFIDITWTASTTSSLEYFVFGNAATGLSTNAGTISEPIDGFDTAFTAGKFPNATLVLAGGTYPISNTAGTAQKFTSASTPMALMAYPGDVPIINIANSADQWSFGFASPIEDIFLQGVTLVGVANANDNVAYRHFWPGSPTYRFVAHNLSFPNVFQGQNAANNSTCIYWSDPGLINNYSQYIILKGNSETNRQTDYGQSYGIFCAYGTSLGLAEFNSATNGEADQNLYIKASNREWTIRANVVQMSPRGGVVFSTGNQTNDDGPSGNNEVCYNLFINNAAGTAGAFTTRSNWAAFNNADMSEWWYRNTVLGLMTTYPATDTGNGPYTFENNAVQYGTSYTSGLYYHTSTGNWVNTAPLPNGITNTGTECQAASGVLDPNTYELTGTYRTQYLGQRGCEVY